MHDWSTLQVTHLLQFLALGPFDSSKSLSSGWGTLRWRQSVSLAANHGVFMKLGLFPGGSKEQLECFL